jgi:hypothetical protein
MRKASIVTLVGSFAFLLFSCASSEPAPVPVIGAPEDLAPLAGEWVGNYEIGAAGRSGSITFHLTENPEGAYGDVLMVPKQDLIRNELDPRSSHGMISSASVLSIEFVRIKGVEIRGKIAPYPDPEAPEATLETHFTGHVDGQWIEGTFVIDSDHGLSPRYGTWRVHRKSVP